MVIKWFGLIVGLFVVGLADFWTGYDVSLSVFYSLPVILAVWMSGRVAGFGVAFLAVVERTGANVATGHHYGHPAVIYWNALVFFFLLGFIVIGASAVRQQLSAAQNKVGILERALRTCGGCQQVEDSSGHWAPLEMFLQENGMIAPAHKLCPDCARKVSAEARAPQGGRLR